MKKGFIFRLGIFLKDSGEQIHCRWLVGLGLMIKDSVMNCPIKEM